MCPANEFCGIEQPIIYWYGRLILTTNRAWPIAACCFTWSSLDHRVFVKCRWSCDHQSTIKELIFGWGNPLISVWAPISIYQFIKSVISGIYKTFYYYYILPPWEMVGFSYFFTKMCTIELPTLGCKQIHQKLKKRD